MSLINGSEIVGLLAVFRVCHIDGRYGGGKTSLAYRLAYEFLRSGEYKYLISNVGSIWRDRPQDCVTDKEGRLNAVVIIDEGGQFIENPAAAKRFQVALRALNCLVFVPSVVPPSSRLRYITIQRVLSFSMLGLPLSLYKWTLKKGFQVESGWFGWWMPSEIYGIYRTDEKPLSDAGIAGFLTEMAGRLDFRDNNFVYSSSVLGVDGDEGGDQGDIGSYFIEAAESIEGVAENIGKIAVSRRRR